MRFIATVGDQQFTVDVEANGHVRRVTLGGRDLTLDWHLIGGEQPIARITGDLLADQYSLLVGHRSYDAYARLITEDEPVAARAGRTVEVVIRGRSYVVSVQDQRSRALETLAGGTHTAGNATIRAPMPGLVSNVLAVEGASVQRGQTVVVLEAMKMENDLTAPREGIVKAVRVAPGQTVAQNEILAIIGDAPGTAPSVEDGEE